MRQPITGPAATAVERPGVFASLGARFLASLIDFVVVIAIPGLIASRLLANAPGGAADAAIAALASLYFIASYTSAGGGYSIGKYALGIRVADALGQPLSVSAAAVRWLLSIGIALPLLSLAIGFERGVPLRTGPAFAIGVPILCVAAVDAYMAVANRVSHRSLHDLAAGSFVVRKRHSGAVQATASFGRRHYAWMALLCALIAFWFVRVYPWARVIGQRSVELMKARAAALAGGKAATLIVAPAFAVQGTDTAWLVSAIATIHAKPATARDAEALRKALACTLAREAPLAFRAAELQLLVTFDPGSRPNGPASVYLADIELTPAACKDQ
jgi:uncharacterized RDD family membrane protein YckC